MFIAQNENLCLTDSLPSHYALMCLSYAKGIIFTHSPFSSSFSSETLMRNKSSESSVACVYWVDIL